TTENVFNPLPEKRLSMPRSWLLSMKLARSFRLTPGTGMLAMNRKITSIASVNRILRRRSGILKALMTAWSMASSPSGPAVLAAGHLFASLRTADLAKARLLQLAVDGQPATARSCFGPAIRPFELGNAAAGCFDSLAGRGGERMGVDLERGRHLSVAEDLD